MPKDRKIIIISNPAAGQRSKPLLDAVTQHLHAQGQQTELVLTAYPGHATTLARACADSGECSLVVAAGGDGTIREVAEGLHGTGTAVGIIPAGTANVLARELGYLPRGRKKPSHIAKVLAAGVDKPVYPFFVTHEEGKILGLCWVGAGFDAETLKHINPKWKARVGRAAFVPAVMKALWHEPSKSIIPWAYRLNPDNLPQGGECGWGIIANIEHYAGPFHLTRKTRVTERGLACLLMPQAGPMARIIDQTLIGFMPLDRRARTHRITGGILELGTSETPIQLDGDLIGNGPVVIEPQETGLMFRAA